VGHLLETRREQCGPDREASRLYAEYRDKIFRYCLGQLRSREEAEDAVQNTFLRVCTALRKGVVPEFEAPWLYKIAHNVCLSRRLGASRRARVEKPADLDLLGDRAAAHTPDTDDLFGLDDALAGMPPNLRRPLLMREWQGMSYAEIAETLEVSHSAVETLIFRARRHLAHALVDPVKRSGRAIAAVFKLNWILDAFKGLAAGTGGAGLAAGAAGLLVAIGGGVAVTVATQDSPAAHSMRVSTAVQAQPGRTGRSAGATSGAQPTLTGARPVAHATRGVRHGGASSHHGPSASAGSSSAPGASQSPAGSTPTQGAASPRAPVNQPSSPPVHATPSRSPAAPPAGTRPSASTPPGSSPTPPTVPDPAGVVPPVSAPAVPAAPDLPPVPPVSVPPLLPPVPLLPPPPPVSAPPAPPLPPPPLPPLPPPPPLPPLTPSAPPAGGALP
jgi:RNA polymerase sigma factor (sigma-70 family)